MNAVPTRMKSPADPSWLPRHRDALMLANLLRVSRLTLLYGETGAGKSALLNNELMALLRRRATDLHPKRATGPRVVVPFPERRSGGLFAGRREVAVLFDGWDETSPVASLQASVAEALGVHTAPQAAPSLSLSDSLVVLAQQHHARLLIILDGFESLLTASPDNEGANRFSEELAQALNRPDLPAHFFISVRDDAQPLLDPWRAQVAGFGDRWLRIRHWSSLRPVTVEGHPEPAPVKAETPLAATRPPAPTLVHSAPASPPQPTVPSAVIALTPKRELELGIDLYLPLEPQEARPPSERVQALWDELLTQPIPGRLPTVVPATAPMAAAVEPSTEVIPVPADDKPPTAPALPWARRTPWMLWSLLLVAVAALMIYTWADSLQSTPPAGGMTDKQVPIVPAPAADIAPAR